MRTEVVKVERVLPNPEQPRTAFDAAALRELADSIRAVGLLQPITVRAVEDGWYVLVDGERRLRAHKLLGLKVIEASVMTVNNSDDMLLLALVANLQRVDLTPIEEGRAYLQMQKTMSLTEISRRLGTNLNRIHNRLRLMELPETIQGLVSAGRWPVSNRTTEAILSLPEPYRTDLALQLAERPGLTIAAVEQAVRRVRDLIHEREVRLAVADNPAVALAELRVTRKTQTWDMLAQAGLIPPWEFVVAAARKTCAGCAWADMASFVTCKECPAVELIVRLTEAANERY